MAPANASAMSLRRGLHITGRSDRFRQVTMCGRCLRGFGLAAGETLRPLELRMALSAEFTYDSGILVQVRQADGSLCPIDRNVK